MAAGAATIYVPDDYPTIQEAADAASSGDTVVVRDGTYTENVNVNKDHLTISSENGAQTTIVEAANSSGAVVDVNADHVTISGFTVKGASGLASAGIEISSWDSNNTVTDNDISSNYYGIEIGTDSNDNTIRDNNISSSERAGIFDYCLLLHSSWTFLTRSLRLFH